MVWLPCDDDDGWWMMEDRWTDGNVGAEEG